MKRILSLVLILILALSAITACGGNETTTKAVDYKLDEVADYLKGVYANLVNDPTTTADFTLINSLKKDGHDYKVEWKTDNASVVVTPVEGANEVKVVIPESKDELNYKLTGTIIAPDNSKIDLVFDLVVPASNLVSIPEAVEAEDGTLVSVKGTVKFIDTAWSDTYKNITVTIVDKDGNELYIYRLATKVEVGDIIVVTGEMATYNGNRQIAQGGTAKIVGKDELDLTFVKSTIPEVLAAEDGAMVEVSGTVLTIDTPWSDSYGNITVTIVDADGNELYIYRMSTKVEQGDIITIQGKVGSYNGNKQIAAGATAVITGKAEVNIDYEKVSITDAIASDDGRFVEVSGTVVSIHTAWSDSFGNISVYIEDAQGNVLYLYRLATNVALGDIITVQGKVGSYEGSKQIAAGATAVKTGHDDTVTEDKNLGQEEDAPSVNLGTPAATLNTMGVDNRTSYSTSQIVYSANGITYTNDKAKSESDCLDQSDSQFATRAYAKSTIKIEYANMTAIVLTLDDYSDGKYLKGLDNMEIEGATITRSGDVVTITFSAPTNVFQSTNLASQIRIEKIDVYTAE